MNQFPYEKVKREVFVKQEAETNSEYGVNPFERKVEELIEIGIVNVNKPYGPTSHQVSAYVQGILNIKKSGHSGTLDPHVTGVLPVALQRGTRIVQFLLKLGKEYVCLMHIHKDVPVSKIQEEMNKWVGVIDQLPPIKSAVKRRMRKREIYYIEILEVKKREVLLRIGSEAGFYVRKFCDDFGKKIGGGAHMAGLVRTKVNGFTDKNWHSLQELKDAYEFWKQGDEREIRKIVLPIESAVEFLPKIWVVDSCVDSLCHGADLNVPGISKFENFTKDENAAVMSLKGELVCVGQTKMESQDIPEKEKGLVLKTKKVFMKTEVYPKYKKQ
ncbi:MAG: RNA-guided pseudouridylation complex pseudouridine synthase subunit Cbf5 [Nanoarchaeota archaeon]|nr:RNA-guided pseudouridylation complex pseudouridine synthase subunit Cbf5 [Nanoarchaeota archaeon]